MHARLVTSMTGNPNRFSEAIEKLKGALKTESEMMPIVLKIKTKLCACHSKVYNTHTYIYIICNAQTLHCVSNICLPCIYLHCIFILYVLSSRILLVVVFYCLVFTCILMLATSFMW